VLDRCTNGIFCGHFDVDPMESFIVRRTGQTYTSSVFAVENCGQIEASQHRIRAEPFSRAKSSQQSLRQDSVPDARDILFSSRRTARHIEVMPGDLSRLRCILPRTRSLSPGLTRHEVVIVPKELFGRSVGFRLGEKCPACKTFGAHRHRPDRA